MPKKSGHGHQEPGWLGVGVSSPAHAKSEGIYHHVHTQHGHGSEYSENAHGFSKARQKSFPSGAKFGGAAGSGKKMKGSKGRGMRAV